MVVREELHRLLDRGTARPLVVVTAARGYGKTTSVARWAENAGAGWYTASPADADPHRFAAGLIAVYAGHGTSADPLDAHRSLSDLVARVVSAARRASRPVVIDDAEHLVRGRSIDLLRRVLSVAGTPPHLVVAARSDITLESLGDRRRGDVLHLHARHLAFDEATVAALLARAGWDDPALAAMIVTATGGWPALVGRVVAELGDGPDGSNGLSYGTDRPSHGTDRPSHGTDGPNRSSGSSASNGERVRAMLAAGGPMDAELHASLEGEDDATLRDLAHLALLDRPDVTSLCAISAEEPAEITARCHRLVRRGLAQPALPSSIDPDGAGATLLPVVRRFVLDQLRRSPLRDEVITATIGALTSTDLVSRASGALADIGAGERLALVMRTHGHELLRIGRADVVARAMAGVPDTHRDTALDLLHGEALEAAGDVTGALARYEAAGAPGHDAVSRLAPAGRLTSEVALRIGRLHHHRGEFSDAIAAYQRGPASDDGSADHAALRAWLATAHWLRGDLDEARRAAGAALRAAERREAAGDLALAHTVLALVAISDGDRRAYERHDRQAFEAADRAGDDRLTARIRVNRGAHHLEEGRTTEALFETDRALALARRSRTGPVLPTALCNRAQVLLRTGRLDEAVADARASLAEFRALGSRGAGAVLALLGDIHQERGDLDVARRCYDDARAAAESVGDGQALVAALIGIARITAGSDPTAAADAVSRLRAARDPSRSSGGLLATAWVALAAGEDHVARRDAEDASRLADRRGDDRGRAEATTLLALLADDPVPRLRECARRWHRLHDPLWSARVELGVARRSADVDERSRTGDLEVRLARLGCAVAGGSYPHRAVTAWDEVPAVGIRVLGGFAVEHAGRPIDPTAWPSPDARRLLMLLVTERGRSTLRERFAALLWPDERHDRIADRFEAALEGVRDVLRDDRGGRNAVVMTDSGALHLRVGSMDVDLTRFERAATGGLHAERSGQHREARSLLSLAATLDGGELLAGEPGTGWADGQRDAHRRTSTAVQQALARLPDDH